MITSLAKKHLILFLGLTFSICIGFNLSANATESSSNHQQEQHDSAKTQDREQVEHGGHAEPAPWAVIPFIV